VLAEHADNQGIEAGGFVELVEHTVCRGREHVKEELDKVEALGGEVRASILHSPRNASSAACVRALVSTLVRKDYGSS
jgi:hypothetical protein